MKCDNLKRGWIRFIASLKSQASDPASALQIWTDIEMECIINDPRSSKNRTRPIAEMSFDEAADLAYFAQKISSPLPSGQSQQLIVPVKLLNNHAARKLWELWSKKKWKQFG